MSDFPHFKCHKLNCKGQTVEACIRRQTSQGKVHDRAKVVHFYDKYPECPGKGNDICEQGLALVEKYPGIVEWAKGLKPRQSRTKMLKRAELAYMEPRSAV